MCSKFAGDCPPFYFSVEDVGDHSASTVAVAVSTKFMIGRMFIIIPLAQFSNQNVNQRNRSHL